MNNENYVIEYASGEWTLYLYDSEMNNLKDIKDIKEIEKLLNIRNGYKLLSNLSYYESWYEERMSIIANWDNVEKRGEINIEFTGDYGTYPELIKINSFNHFIKKLDNLDCIIDNFMCNGFQWEEEEKDPYGSRGLSISDFIEIRKY